MDETCPVPRPGVYLQLIGHQLGNALVRSLRDDHLGRGPRDAVHGFDVLDVAAGEKGRLSLPYTPRLLSQVNRVVGRQS